VSKLQLKFLNVVVLFDNSLSRDFQGENIMKHKIPLVKTMTDQLWTVKGLKEEKLKRNPSFKWTLRIIDVNFKYKLTMKL